MSLDCSINANNGNNALFATNDIIVQPDIDRINGNGVAKSNGMNSISKYTTSVLKELPQSVDLSGQLHESLLSYVSNRIMIL